MLPNVERGMRLAVHGRRWHVCGDRSVGQSPPILFGRWRRRAREAHGPTGRRDRLPIPCESEFRGQRIDGHELIRINQMGSCLINGQLFVELRSVIDANVKGVCLINGQPLPGWGLAIKILFMSLKRLNVSPI